MLQPRRGGETGAFAAQVHLGDLVAAVIDNTADVVKEWGHQPADVPVEGRILAAGKYLSRIAEAVAAMDSVEDVRGLGPALTEYGAVAAAVDLAQSGTAPKTSGDTIRPLSGSEAAAKPMWSALQRDAAWDDARIVALGPLLRYSERLVAMKKGRVDSPADASDPGESHWTRSTQAEKFDYLRSEVFPHLDSLRRSPDTLRRPEGAVQMPEGSRRRRSQSGRSAALESRRARGGGTPPPTPVQKDAEARTPERAQSPPGPAASVARTRSAPQRLRHAPRRRSQSEPQPLSQPPLDNAAAASDELDELADVEEEDDLLVELGARVSETPRESERGRDVSAGAGSTSGSPREDEEEEDGPWGAAREDRARRERQASDRFLETVMTGVRKASGQALSRVWDVEGCWPARPQSGAPAAAAHCRPVVDAETCDFAASAPPGAKVPSWASVEEAIFGDSSLVQSFDAEFHVEAAVAETNRLDRAQWDKALAAAPGSDEEGAAPPMVLRFEDEVVDGYVEENVFGDEVEAPDADLSAPARSGSVDDVRVEVGAGPSAWAHSEGKEHASSADADASGAARLQGRGEQTAQKARLRASRSESQ